MLGLVLISCTSKKVESDRSNADDTEKVSISGTKDESKTNVSDTGNVSDSNNDMKKESDSFESLARMSQPETFPTLCYEIRDSEGEYIYLTDHRILDNYTPEVRSKLDLQGVALKAEDGHIFIIETVDYICPTLKEGVKTVPFQVLSKECYSARDREIGTYFTLTKAIQIEKLPTIAEAQIIIKNIDKVQHLLMNSPSEPLKETYWCKDFGEWSDRWDCYVSHPAFWVRDPNVDYAVGSEPESPITYLDTSQRAKLRYVTRLGSK